MPSTETPVREATLRTYIGSSLFFLYIILSVVVYAFLILLALPFDFSIRYAIAKNWSHSISLMIKWCCGITYEIEGLENIPQNKAVVVLSKHQSAWETVSFRHLFPQQTTLLKRSLLAIPLGGWALASLKPIAIDRDKPRQSLHQLLKQGKSALDAGFWVVIFPEGTRTMHGEKNKFNAGGAMLAHKTGYPVLPIAHNAGIVWPRYSFLKYSGVIKVKIGALIEVENKKTQAINAEAETWIAQAMEEL